MNIGAYYFNEKKESNRNKIKQYGNFETLTQFLISMFDYEFSEKTIDPVHLEKYLLLNGMCAIWKCNEEWIVSECSLAEKPNVYGEGTSVICVTENGKTQTFKDYENNENVVVIFNDFLKNPDFNISKFAELLSTAETSLLSGLIFTRFFPIPVAKNTATKNAIDNAIKKLISGELSTVISDNVLSEFSDGKDIEIINLTDDKAVDKLQYINHCIDDLIRQFFRYYGHTMSTASKMAQMNETELKNGDSITHIIPYLRLTERQKGIDRVNKILGIKASIKFSPIWDLLYNNFEKMFVNEQKTVTTETETDTLENKGSEENVLN